MKMVVTIVFFSLIVGGLLPGIILMATGQTMVGLITMGAALGFFALIWFLFLRNVMRQARVLRTGEPASAIVLEVQDTNITINNNPMAKLKLEVQPKRGAKFTTEVRVIVPRLNPGYYTPGMTVQVKIDPNDPTYVAIDPTAAVKSRIEAFSPESQEIEEKKSKALYEVLRKSDDLYKELIVSGSDAEGVILSAWPLNVTVNEIGQAMEFLVEVKIPGRQAFNAEIKGVVHKDRIWKYQAGQKVSIKYDPSDPENRVAINAPSAE
jgi:hypothetical protein